MYQIRDHEFHEADGSTRTFEVDTEEELNEYIREHQGHRLTVFKMTLVQDCM